MAYERVNWENLPSTKTPINQTNLNKMENGIDQAGAEIFVGAEKPTTGEKVWLKKDENSIYVRNSNGVYEEFIKKEDEKIIKTLESTTPSSDGEFLSGLNGITKILGFQIYNYEQWREGYLCGTLVTNKEGTSLYFLSSPDNTSYYGKPIRIFYID